MTGVHYMPTTIRLSPKTERRLSLVARKERKTKSELIKGALDRFLENYLDSQTPYELGKDLFGQEGSGRNDLSTRRKEILKEKLRAKISR